MDKQVNIREIAKAAGVSTASVSRALQPTPSPYLSEKSRRRILDVCARMRYYPNEHTRRMLSRKANTVAIFFPPFMEMNTDFLSHKLDDNFGDCMLGAQSVLAAQGIGLLLTEVNEEFLESRKYLQMCRGKMIDGILIWGMLDQDRYLNELAEEKIPLVLLQNSPEDFPGHTVTADDYYGASAVTEKLIRAGHRKIAVASPPLGASTGRNRYRGVVDTLARHGITDYFEFSERGYGYNFGGWAAMEIAGKARGVTAVIMPNDLAAWGCLDTFRKLRIRVPEDISLVGGDGLWVPGEIQISSYKTPAYEIGRTGAGLLLEQFDGATGFKHCRLPVQLVEGNTVRKLEN